MARMFYQVIKDDEEAKREFDSFSYEPYTGECFGSYNYSYEGDNSLGNIYFGFIAHPRIKELADEINNNFKNIKINIIGMKKIQVMDSYELERLDKPEFYNYCMFSVELDEAYSKNANFYLKFVLAQFMRGYCPYYEHFYKLVKSENNLIDSNLDAQAISNYGAWLDCDPEFNYECSRETFNLLDNITLVNNSTENAHTDEMPSIHKFIRIMEGKKPKFYLENPNDDEEYIHDYEYEDDEF